MIETGRMGVRLGSERLTLRLPIKSDYAQWTALRSGSRDFLEPWEPTWKPDHLTRSAFLERVRWSRRCAADRTAFPFLLFLQTDGAMVGGVTLDNIRVGAAQSASIGYWVGKAHARQGYMREAIAAVVHFAFVEVGLSRIEAACLPENAASCGLLEKTGFKFEGVAQAYLEIHGRWRNHVLYANLRRDRRGRADDR